MKRNASKLIVIGIVALLAFIFFAFDLGQYLTLDYIKARQQAFDAYYAEHTGLTIAIYMIIYITVTALSLPGATVMTLAGGGLFGLRTGIVVISFASTIGATLAFLVSRFLLRDYVQKKFGDKLRTINEGVKKDGAFYLLSLRLVPLFPFFVINLLMGLTPIRTLVYYIVSQVGMLPGTFVYVNAGTQLAKIDSAQGILSPGLIFSFVLLGIFPLIAKRVLSFVQARKALAGFPRPQKI